MLPSPFGAGVLVAGGSEDSVGVSAGVSDVDPAGPGEAGGAVGLCGPDRSSTTCPIVVPLPLPPTVPPLAHSKPVIAIMASTKPPKAPTATTPQLNLDNRRARSEGAAADAGRERWARERTLCRLRSSEAW